MREDINGKDNKYPELHKVLFSLMSAHRRKIHNEFVKVGLTQGQPKILDFLIENDGCIQREIAENCKIEAATVTNLLANMEKAGLVYRAANPKNRRILNVFLTDKGKEAQKEVDKIFNKLDTECFIGFSEEEQNKTLEALIKIQENLLK